MPVSTPVYHKYVGDVIPVKFGRKTYPTRLTDLGTQRFIQDPEYERQFCTGEIDLNQIALRVGQPGGLTRTQFMELRMKLGYSVDGLCDCYPNTKVVNPLWNKWQEEMAPIRKEAHEWLVKWEALPEDDDRRETLAMSICDAAIASGQVGQWRDIFKKHRALESQMYNEACKRRNNE